VEEYRTATSEGKKSIQTKEEDIYWTWTWGTGTSQKYNESKSFYQKLNKSRKDFQPITILRRNKEGSGEGDILCRWAEHFDELLNKEFFNQNQNVTSQKTYQVHSDTDEPAPTLDEVENAIKKLRTTKHQE